MPEGAEVSRREKFEADGAEILWPEVDLFYLVNYLWEAGPCLYGGMGPVPLSWQELQSWQEQTGTVLQPWELTIIKAASRAYAEQISISGKADCPPPNRVVEHDPEKLAKHIKSILR